MKKDLEVCDLENNIFLQKKWLNSEMRMPARYISKNNFKEKVKYTENVRLLFFRRLQPQTFYIAAMLFYKS